MGLYFKSGPKVVEFAKIKKGESMNRNKTRVAQFIENVAQDIFFFLFFLLFLSVLRGAFIIVFRHTLTPSTTAADIAWTLWYGLRISLKTVGAITLIPFLVGSVGQAIWPKWLAQKIRLYWGVFCCLGLSILFQTRIPYYKEFQNAFSPFIFNTFHDDVYAIVKTAIDQYHAVSCLIMGLAMAAVTGGIFAGGLKLTRRVAAPVAQLRHAKWIVVGICIAVIPFAVFVRRGGAWDFEHSIYWKNAARMDQHLLNEAILDDVQALYKASRIHKKFKKTTRNLSVQEVREAAERLTGKPYQAPSLLPLLTRVAPGALIQKPRHIFLIVAETYMQWPLLEQYNYLPVAKGLKKLMARPDSVHVPNFLSASNGTMFGLTSVLLGLPELNLHTANRPTAQKPYETSLSVQLKKLGYKTRFFYGGFDSWENVGLFMKNQQMDEDYYYADFGIKGGVWGIHDKEFFEGIENKMTDEPSFNLILTSTNHPPYTVDMSAEPTITPAPQMRALLPENASDPATMVERLQHFEYADKYLTQFVEDMLARYPDSLFIITGDHADRYTMTPNPSLYERLAVPMVMVGKGIRKQMMAENASGAHMDIVPTVMELIAPKGMTYYALGQSVLKGGIPGLHAYYFITDRVLGDLNSEQQELLPGAVQPLSAEEVSLLRQRLKDEQTIAAWLILHGVELN